MNKFKEVYDKEIGRLSQFIPIVSRVHGNDHNEFYEVEKVFNSLKNKVEDNNYDLDEEFNLLTKITTNYEVPKDTCETYEYVYKKLSILNKEYLK